MAEEKKSLTAVEEAELSKAPLYRLGAKLLKNRLPVSLIATFFTALMAYQALGMQMSTAFNDLLPYGIRSYMSTLNSPNSSAGQTTLTSC